MNCFRKSLFMTLLAAFVLVAGSITVNVAVGQQTTTDQSDTSTTKPKSKSKTKSADTADTTPASSDSTGCAKGIEVTGSACQSKEETK